MEIKLDGNHDIVAIYDTNTISSAEEEGKEEEEEEEEECEASQQDFTIGFYYTTRK